LRSHDELDDSAMIGETRATMRVLADKVAAARAATTRINDGTS